MSDFNQTVDLKEKMAQKSKPQLPAKPQAASSQASFKPKPVLRKKAEEIDEMFSDETEIIQSPAAKKEMQSINRAPKSGFREGEIKKWLLILVGLMAIFLFYYFFTHKNKQDDTANEQPKVSGWYAIKLLNNETYYGQIKDLSSDPVVVTSVYYNYDEINKDSKEVPKTSESGALRLVKRGKEAYGPDGTMSLVRAQVVSMETLKEDSKVLKAILDYEKK